jgi:hypothetical protein
MSPEISPKTGKLAAFSDIYTALLALAFVVVFSTAVFLAIKCTTEYGSAFSIAKP